MMTNKKGFTLAEVLITIGIIGVIAAVTLPALNTNLVNNQLEVQTRKFYTQFTKAFDLFKAENQINKISDADFNKNQFIKKYMNIARNCSSADACYASKYQTLNNKEISSTSWFSKNSTYELADGAVFTLTGDNDFSSPLSLTFDVNGRKGPNKIGYDLWNVSVFYDGSIDEGTITPEVRKNYSGEDLEELIEQRFNSCKAGASYGGCFGHFKMNGFKFDY